MRAHLHLFLRVAIVAAAIAVFAGFRGSASARIAYIDVCNDAEPSGLAYDSGSCYPWDVTPAYVGPYYVDNASAAKAEPPPPPAVTPALPIWRNLYDWPNGHGYVGWHAGSSSQPGAYGMQSALGGQYGLWLWPVGGQSYRYSENQYAEWTYTAPGTTRLANATMQFSYRNKLLAHHCIDIGFRTAAGAVITHNEHCKPAAPPDSQRQVNVTLVDPSSNPTSKVLYVRIRVDCGGAATCSKNIPALDPLATGGYVRLLKEDMILVDDDYPAVTVSGPFYDLHGEYINGQNSYGVTINTFDAGSGIQRLWLERSGSGAILSASGTCDFTHRTPSLDNYLCGAAADYDGAVSTVPFPEGANTFVGKASDLAGNTGQSESWTIYIDRTPPTQASGIQLTGFDPSISTARISWTPGSDPPLADGSPGSGVQDSQYRYSVNGGGWTDWASTDEPGFDLSNAALGQNVAVEVRSSDAVGNLSQSATGSVTVYATDTTIDPYSSPNDGPDTIRSLTSTQTAQAIQIAQSSPSVAAVIGSRTTTASDVIAWTTVSGRVYGAELSLNWTDAVSATNASVPAINFDSTGTYSDATSSLTASNLTSLDVMVDLARGKVVSIVPGDTATIPDVPGVQLFSARKLRHEQKWTARGGVIATFAVCACGGGSSNAANLRYVTKKLAPQLGNDTLWNYDFDTSTYHPATSAALAHADNPISLIFWGNADVLTAKDMWNRGQAKVNFGSVFGGKLWANPAHARIWDKADPGEPGYGRNNGPTWDSDRGAYLGHAGPEDGCTVNTYKWHYRVYAPHSSNRMWNPSWQYYVIGSTHVDFRELCPYGWSGEADRSAHKLAQAVPNHKHEVLHHALGFIPYCDYVLDPWRVYDPVRGLARENTQPLFNKDKRGRMNGHIYDNDGLATMIEVDHQSHPVSSSDCNPSGS
jgi:hypothetical protein